MVGKAIVPRPLRQQAVHLGYYNALNFGDMLGPMITEFVLGAPVFEGHYRGADLTAVGSVLEALEKAKNPDKPFVWGSGFIDDGGRWQGKDIQPVAVRGALTRERVAHMSDGSIELGDPGLLVGRMFPALNTVTKRYKLSVVPHILDRESTHIADLRQEWPDVHVINVSADPRLVLEEIAASEMVLSSSLHGLVCADGLGIPNQWTPMTDAVEGAGYKFSDYYSAFDAEAKPVGSAARIGDSS